MNNTHAIALIAVISAVTVLLRFFAVLDFWRT